MRIPWRKHADDGLADRAAASPSADAADSLEAQLRERGVTADDARQLAGQISAHAAAQGRAQRAAFIDGVAACWHASGETRARLDRTLSEIKEVERLMGAFTGELSKLDEVLEVLAAYVRRMRTSKAETSEGQTLH